MSRLEEFKAAVQEFVDKVAAKFAGEDDLPDGAYRFAENAEVPIECARPGTFVSMEGQRVPFTAELLKGIASRFTLSEENPVHLKIGHKPIETDTPDYGRVTRLEFDEGKQRLVAYAKPEPELVRKNRAEGFRRCSMELVKKGDWMLDALSFLGARKPAIAGLAPIHLADGSKVYFASGEGTDPDPAEAENPDPETIEKRKDAEGLDKDSTLLLETEDEKKKRETQKMSEQDAAELATARGRIARFEKDALVTAKAREKAFLDENVKRIPMKARKAVEGRLSALFAAESLAETEQRLEFAAPDGKTVKETASEIVCAILLALPEQTDPGDEEDTAKNGADEPGANVKPFALGRNPRVQFAKSEMDEKILDLLTEMRKTKPETTYTQALEAYSEQEAAK